MENLRINSVERKKRIRIVVNGREEIAFKGESVLAALIASGYKVIKKSPVNKEKRGGLCGMGACFECAAKINGNPNVRTCMINVEEKMEIEIEK